MELKYRWRKKTRFAPTPDGVCVRFAVVMSTTDLEFGTAFHRSCESELKRLLAEASKRAADKTNPEPPTET